MSGPVAAGVWGRRVPAGGIPILASIDPSSAVSCAELPNAGLLCDLHEEKFFHIEKTSTCRIPARATTDDRSSASPWQRSTPLLLHRPMRRTRSCAQHSSSSACLWTLTARTRTTRKTTTQRTSRPSLPVCARPVRFPRRSLTRPMRTARMRRTVVPATPSSQRRLSRPLSPRS